MIETSQFQTFITVANMNSFSRAAEELGVTQSAISQSIKNLESKVGVKLFKRAGKKVLLTLEGEKLYVVASEFMTKMQHTLDEIQQNTEEMSGRIRVGAVEGIGKSWLALELVNFQKAYPDLIIEIELGFKDDLLRDFEANKLDLLVLPNYSLPSSGESVSLGDETATLVFPKSDKFKIGSDVSLEELAAYPTVLFERRAPLYSKWTQNHFGRVPKNINIRHVINSYEGMFQAVVEGMGIAVIPTHVFRKSSYRDKVSTVKGNFDVKIGPLCLVYHKNARELLRIRTVIDHLVERQKTISLTN